MGQCDRCRGLRCPWQTRTVLPPRKSDLGPWSLQERNGPCSRRGEVGLQSGDRLLSESGMGKTAIQPACLFWLDFIQPSASDISPLSDWLKFRGSRWSSQREPAGVLVTTYIHAPYFPKKELHTENTHTQQCAIKGREIENHFVQSPCQFFLH